MPRYFTPALFLLLSACASGGGGTMLGGGGTAPLPVTVLPPPAPLFTSIGAPAAATHGNAPGGADAVGAASFDSWDWANEPRGVKPLPGTVFPLLQSVLELDAQRGTVAADPATMAAGATVTVLGSERTVRLQVPALGIDVTTSPELGSNQQLFWGQYSQYTFYGSWGVTGSTPGVTGAAFVYGYSTPAAVIPAQGRARHHGDVRGTVISRSGNVPLVGRGDLTIDFGNHTVNGSMKEMRQGVIWDERAPFSNPFNDIAITATQSGNRINGTASVTGAPNSTISLSAGASGHFNGELFGPAANELGAVWTLSDGTRSAVGTFLGYGNPVP
jgi:hypothetical protein